MQSPTDHTARLRGAAVGAASGAVAIFAHALGGGTTAPEGSALALLFAACALIGVIVASVRPRYGLLSVMGMLAAGQGIGHLALSMSPGHHHHMVMVSPLMAATHLVAIPVGAMVIRAAETGMRAAVTSVRRFILALGSTPVPSNPPARSTPLDDRAVVQRLLVSPGIARRGPPLRAHLLSHLAPA